MADVFDNTSHGFMTPTDQDHRPWLWTVAMLSCIYSLLALGARVTSKWDMLWYDDAVLAVAYIISFAHYGTIFSSINYGLGVSSALLPETDALVPAKTYFAARILLLVALCFSKISVLAFSRRIFSGNLYFEKIIFSTALGMMIAWGILAATLSSVGCNPANVLVGNYDTVCYANRARWITIIVLDVFTEIILLAVPVWFVSKNQIKASKKRVVAFVFAFRLVVAGFAVATAVNYFYFLDGGEDNIGLAPTVAWQEVLLATSLISASIPSLRAFLWAFMSREMWHMYGINTENSMSGSIPMRSMNKSHRSGLGSQARSEDQIGQTGGSRLRPDWMHYSVDVGRGTPKSPKDNRASGSLKSDSTEQMIIHRNVEFEVR